MRMISLFDVRRLQLWSDANQENFAVRLSNESNFRAATSPAASYILLIDEAEFLHDMEYDWNYLLMHWTGVKNGKIKLVDSIDEEQPIRNVPLNGKDATEKPKAILKCHYCGLLYSSEKKRSEHEATWHAEKVRMQAFS